MSLPDEIEARLLARLVARDERAFNELFEAYSARVFRLVRRMLASDAEAEEITLDVFVQVFKSIDRFRGDSKLTTWIYRIAVNLCKNRVKYLKVRHADKQDELDGVAERVPLGDESHGHVAHVPRPDEAFAGRQVERIVQECIAALEPSFREVLVLRDVEELSYEEIEAITGLALGTVKSRIFRARGQLRALVEARLGETIR